MKRKILILVLLIITCFSFTFGLIGCGDDEKVIETDGESTVIETTLTPSKIDSAEKTIYAFIGKLRDFNSYEITAEGATKAPLVNQTVKSKTIKNGDEFYKSDYSSSTFVHAEHVAFFKGDKVVYDDKNQTPKDLKVSTKEAYSKVYGLTPDFLGLAGYIVNKDSLKFAEKTSDDNDILNYRIILDTEKSTGRVKIQMKEFGGLTSYPDFTEATIYLSIKNDWTPVSITVDVKYDVSLPVLGNLSCEQNLVYNFSKVNEEVSIPDTELFNGKIGTTPSEVKRTKTSNFNTLATAIFGKGVTAKLNVHTELFSDPYTDEASGKELNNPFELTLDVYAKYYPEEYQSGNYDKMFKFKIDLSVSEYLSAFLKEFSTGLFTKFIPEDVISVFNILTVGDKLSVFYDGENDLYVTASVNGTVNQIFYSVDHEMLTMLFSSVDFLFDKAINDINIEGVTFDAIKPIAGLIIDSISGYVFTSDLIMEGSELPTRLLNETYKYLLEQVVKAISDDISKPIYESIINALLGATVTGFEYGIRFPENGLSELFIKVLGIPQECDESTLLEISAGGKFEVDENVFGELSNSAKIYQENDIAFIQEIINSVTNDLELSSENDSLIETAIEYIKDLQKKDLLNYVTGYENIIDGDNDGKYVANYKKNKEIADEFISLVSVIDDVLIYEAENESRLSELFDKMWFDDDIFENYLNNAYDGLWDLAMFEF